MVDQQVLHCTCKMSNVVNKRAASVAPQKYATFSFDQPDKYIQIARAKLNSPLPAKSFFRKISAFEKSAKAKPKRKQRQLTLPLQSFLATTGGILSIDQIEPIWLFLPARYQVGRAVLVFNTQDDGISISTLLHRVHNYAASIIVIKTTRNEIFGGFCSGSWSKRHEIRRELAYFGTGETFLFSCSPNSHIYPWVGWTSATTQCCPTNTSLFLAACNSTLVIGGGGGSGIRFNSDLSRGHTSSCFTFNNYPLCESGDFSTVAVEVYGLLLS